MHQHSPVRFGFSGRSAVNIQASVFARWEKLDPANAHLRTALVHQLHLLLRRDLFPGALSEDGCWSMLLELFMAGSGGNAAKTKDLVFVSGQSETTALRIIDRLVAEGLVSRNKDPRDGRVTLNRLTEVGMMRLHLFFTTLAGLEHASAEDVAQNLAAIVKRLERRMATTVRQDFLDQAVTLWSARADELAGRLGEDVILQRRSTR